MRFTLLDRVVAVDPGKSITAIKTLSLSEEYLADHFPRFPVMPGVLMLESMTQAAAWAIRLGEDFAHSIVVLREARNVKYGDFVEPGKTLTVTAEVLSQDERTTKIKASGTITLGHRDAAGVLQPNLNERRAHHPLMADAPDHTDEKSDNHPEGIHHVLFEDGRVQRLLPNGLHRGDDHLYRNHDGKVAAGNDAEDAVIGDSHDQP